MIKVNLPRYKFSKLCEPQLRNFFRIVGEQKYPEFTPSHVKALWEAFLPVDESFKEKLKSVEIAPVNEVIDLIESDEEDQNLVGSFRDNINNEHNFLMPGKLQLTETMNLGIKTAEELANEIQELLETESLLSEAVIKKLGSEHQRRLPNLFAILTKDLNSEYILKLWKSISATNCIERNIVGMSFFQHVLAGKILNKCDSYIALVLQEALVIFPDDVLEILLRILLETTQPTELKKLKDNLNILPDYQKNILLREFEDKCAKLELHHLVTVPSLVTAHTDVSSLYRLVDLMSSVCKDFVSDKSFGKLLLEIVQVCGGNIINCEDQVRYILSTHKSAFKTQIAKFFESSVQDRKMFSQSVSLAM